MANLVHTGEVGLATSTDEAILVHAVRERRAVVTLDADFHAFLALSGASSPSVIRLRIEGLRAAGEVARELDKTPAQVVTAWILSHPEITVAICGSDTVEQLEDSVGAVAWTLDEDARRRLDDVSTPPAVWA